MEENTESIRLHHAEVSRACRQLILPEARGQSGQRTQHREPAQRFAASLLRQERVDDHHEHACDRQDNLGQNPQRVVHGCSTRADAALAGWLAWVAAAGAELPASPLIALSMALIQ